MGLVDTYKSILMVCSSWSNPFLYFFAIFYIAFRGFMYFRFSQCFVSCIEKCIHRFWAAKLTWVIFSSLNLSISCWMSGVIRTDWKRDVESYTNLGGIQQDWSSSDSDTCTQKSAKIVHDSLQWQSLNVGQKGETRKYRTLSYIELETIT